MVEEKGRRAEGLLPSGQGAGMGLDPEAGHLLRPCCQRLYRRLGGRGTLLSGPAGYPPLRPVSPGPLPLHQFEVSTSGREDGPHRREGGRADPGFQVEGEGGVPEEEDPGASLRPHPRVFSDQPEGRSAVGGEEGIPLREGDPRGGGKRGGSGGRPLRETGGGTFREDSGGEETGPQAPDSLLYPSPPLSPGLLPPSSPLSPLPLPERR